MKNILLIIFLLANFISYGQYTGATPYTSQFGANESVYKSGANWRIINVDDDDMVFAVVNKYGRVVAHAYIEAGDSFMFTDLPIGSYSYKFSSDDGYFEKKTSILLDGCDPDVYICEGEAQWEHQVWVETTGGYSSGRISKKNFLIINIINDIDRTRKYRSSARRSD